LSTAESTDVTYIPCEYCQKQIDFNQFSTHTVKQFFRLT